MTVVIATIAFYLIVTFMPLAVAFCPYNTPLSSRRFWRFICRVVGFTDESGHRFVPQCQREEKDRSEETTPDVLTTRALGWLIRHSQDKLSVDTAIRAVSNTVLETSVWKLLSQDSLITLVAQKFTALFNGALDQETDELCSQNLVFSGSSRALETPAQESPQSPVVIKRTTSVTPTTPEASRRKTGFADVYTQVEEQIIQASLYGRALAKIVKHARLEPIGVAEDGVYSYTTSASDGTQTDIILSKDQVAAVERGLYVWVSHAYTCCIGLLNVFQTRFP